MSIIPKLTIAALTTLVITLMLWLGLVAGPERDIQQQKLLNLTVDNFNIGKQIRCIESGKYQNSSWLITNNECSVYSTTQFICNGKLILIQDCRPN